MKKSLCAVFVAAAFCALLSFDNRFNNPSQAQTSVVEDNAGVFRRESFARLIGATQKTGSVRVIVGLNADFHAEGTLSKSAFEKQRLDIKQAQSDFLSRLDLTERAGEIKQFETIPFVALTANATTLERMRADAAVTSIEEDALDAPHLAQSTGIVGAPAVWSSGFSGAGQTVAILDTGVNKNHEFLAGKIVSEACYSTTFADTNATSVCPGGAEESTVANSGLNCDTTITGCAHGTHVAGIAAGRGTTFSGVARDASIIAVQVFSRVNNTTSCGTSPAPCALSYSSDQISGLERVLALRGSLNIASVNMSLGGGQNSTYCDASNASRKAVIDNLRSFGIATVISSGNNSYPNAMGAPACISSAVSVGSTGDGSSGASLDTVVSSSNSASFLNLLAPGQWINSSVASGTLTNVYQNYSGTSMAAPHVAGAWAILRQSKPDASVTQILNALTKTGQPITDSRNSIVKPRINIPAAMGALAGSQTRFDYDNDGRADVSVFRPDNGTWYLLNSQTGFTGAQFGASGDRIIPADYDGDGRTDLAVFRNGVWYLQRSSQGFAGIGFGIASDVPQPADYTGDGKADLAVYRPSTGVWYVYNIAANQTIAAQFGASEDKPVAADYDGDGKADYAVFRPSTGIWYLQRSQLGFTGFQFGASADKPVPADYDGDGKADLAAFRPSNGTWYLQRSLLGFTGVQFGVATDAPATADYDGDGKADLAVFRNGTWYLQRSVAGFTGISFGAANDKPAPNAFVP